MQWILSYKPFMGRNRRINIDTTTNSNAISCYCISLFKCDLGWFVNNVVHSCKKRKRISKSMETPPAAPIVSHPYIHCRSEEAEAGSHTPGSTHSSSAVWDPKYSSSCTFKLSLLSVRRASAGLHEKNIVKQATACHGGLQLFGDTILNNDFHQTEIT